MQHQSERLTDQASLHNIAKKLLVKMKSAFLECHLRLSDDYNIIDYNHAKNHTDQLECLLNRYAYMIISNTSLGELQRMTLRDNYRQCCMLYREFIEAEYAEPQFASGKHSPNTSSSGMSSAEDPYLGEVTIDDEDDNDDSLYFSRALDDGLIEKSPTHSPPRHGREKTPAIPAPMVSFFDEQFLHSCPPTAPPMSEAGSPRSRRGYASDVESRSSTGPIYISVEHKYVPPLSFAQVGLYPQLSPYRKDIRVYYQLLIDLCCEVNLDPDLVLNMYVDIAHPRQSTADSFQDALRYFAEDCISLVTLPTAKVIQVVDYLCAARSHMMGHFFFSRNQEVHAALSLLATHVTAIGLHIPLHADAINKVVERYNLDVKKSPLLRQECYRYACQQIINGHEAVMQRMAPNMSYKLNSKIKEFHACMNAIFDYRLVNEPSVEAQLHFAQQRIRSAGFDYLPNHMSDEMRYHALQGYLKRLIVKAEKQPILQQEYQQLAAVMGDDFAVNKQEEILRYYGFNTSKKQPNAAVGYVSL